MSYSNQQLWKKKSKNIMGGKNQHKTQFAYLAETHQNNYYKANNSSTEQLAVQHLCIFNLKYFEEALFPDSGFACSVLELLMQ